MLDKKAGEKHEIFSRYLESAEKLKSAEQVISALKERIKTLESELELKEDKLNTLLSYANQL